MTSTNQTLDDQEEQMNKSLLAFKIVCFFVISIVGVIGNVSLSTSLLRFSHRCKSTEYFILNLSLTDLIVCIIGIPLDIYEQLHGSTWPYGSFLCKVIYPLQTLFVLISSFTLTAMSLERHRAIMSPFKPFLSRTVLLFCIGMIWVLGIAAVAPYANVLTLTDGICEEQWPGNSDANYYTLALFIVDYCLPLTIITTCYSRAGFKLQKNSKQFQTVKSERFSSTNQILAQKRRDQQNKRVIKKFSFAVVIFMICMLPGDCYWMWISFGDDSTFKYGSHFQTFTNILVYTNSAINPFIFGACRTTCLRAMCSTNKHGKWRVSLRSLLTKNTKDCSHCSESGPERETAV